MDANFWDIIRNRRSIYGLSDEKIVSMDRVEQIVRDTLACVPSAFNSQGTRIVLLFDDHSRKFWKMVLESIRAVTNDEQYAASEQKIRDSFSGGYGTLLFFEEQSIMQNMQTSFPKYAARFPVWSQQSNAMHQFVIWSALESEGLGASLQHYDPLVDEAAHKEWNIPETWKLTAQIPFGKPVGVPKEKVETDTDSRIMVFK